MVQFIASTRSDTTTAIGEESMGSSTALSEGTQLLALCGTPHLGVYNATPPSGGAVGESEHRLICLIYV